MLRKKFENLLWLILLFQFTVLEIQSTNDIHHKFQNSVNTQNLNIQKCDIFFQSKEKRAAICETVIRVLNFEPEYEDQDKLLYINYSAFSDEDFFCKEQSIRVYNKFMTQMMMPCFALHKPIRTDQTLDYYNDEIYVSPGFEENHVIIYKKHRMRNPKDDFIMPHEETWLQWDMLLPAISYLFQNNMLNTLEYAYTVDTNEVQLIYDREIVSTMGTDRFNLINEISESNISPLNLFYICSTITQNAFLSVEMQKKFAEAQSVQRFFIAIIKCVNENKESVENNEELILYREVYKIPGTKDFNYVVSSGPRRNSLVIYRYQLKVEQLIHSAHSSESRVTYSVYCPILFVENIMLEQVSKPNSQNEDAPAPSNFPSDGTGSPPPVTLNEGY